MLDYILRTNLFNFIIFAGIIAFLYIKLDVTGKLDGAKNSVKENIEKSEETKKISAENLSKVEEQVAHLSEEIEEIISKSTENAKLVGTQILADADKAVENIKENSLKLVENKTALLRNDLLKRASLASVEVAKNHIISELNNNSELHTKLIDESVEAINELKEEEVNG